MKFLLRHLASVLTIVGLAAVIVLEAWRPGVVSGALNLTWVWLISVGLLLADRWLSTSE